MRNLRYNTTRSLVIYTGNVALLGPWSLHSCLDGQDMRLDLERRGMHTEFLWGILFLNVDSQDQKKKMAENN
jgi:hypothetical protein